MNRSWIPVVAGGLALYLGACGDDDAPTSDPGAADDPVSRALAAPPTTPEEALEACADIPFPEMATTCRVEAAAFAATGGDDANASAACADIPEGTWRQECHFRVGEELARAGYAVAALRHCVQAGRFGRYCLTHAGWGLPPDPRHLSTGDPAEEVARIRSALTEIEAVLEGAPDGLEGEGRDIFRARLWYNLYLGTGVADPGPARAAPDPLAPYAWGAFALEAVRLLFPESAQPGSDAVQTVLQVAAGERPVPTGEPLPVRERHGRYNSPIPAPHEFEAPRVPVYGGGMRLVGADPQEDRVIAVLEGFYFRAATPADFFLPWTRDPRDRVRWTAARLFRLCAPQDVDMEAVLTEWAEGDDPALAWHARDALEHRTWERRRGGYR